jgi:hypothetical protein
LHEFIAKMQRVQISDMMTKSPEKAEKKDPEAPAKSSMIEGGGLFASLGKAFAVKKPQEAPVP